MITIPLQQLPCPGSYEIESTDPAKPGAFVVHHHAGISAFVNRCPHTGAPLNWLPNRFLDSEQKYILCSLHGARFNHDDGVCVTGPCQGQALTSVPTRIVNDEIIVSFDP